MLFRILSVLVIGGVAAAIAADAKRRLGSWTAARRLLRSAPGMLFRSWNGGNGAGMFASVGALRRGAWVLTTVLALLLALSGFLPVMFAGEHPSGTFLLMHVVAAPLFAIALAAVSLLWSHHQQITEQDMPLLREVLRGRVSAVPGGFHLLARMLFWAALVLALPLMLSIILSLYPLFGTEGNRALIELHGYTAVGLVAVALLHGYCLILHMTTRSSTTEA